MGRLRIMVRGVEQCVRLIWSVIVLRWSYTDFRFRAMPRIKSSQIHSSQAVAGRRLEYGGHTTTPGSIILRVLTPMRVQSHAWSFIPGWSLKVLYPRAKAPGICTPSSCALGAAPAPTASRGACDAEGNRECNSGFCRRLRLGSCIRNILLIEVILDGHVGCGTATRGAAHLPQTYFVVSSELEWRPMA